MYKNKKSIISGYVALITAVLFFAYIYKLKMISIMLLIFLGLIICPYIIKQKRIYRERREQFNDIDVYLHQMAYSFMRTPKISTAFDDLYMICRGNLKKCVEKAIDELRYSYNDEVYKEAFGIIEREYPCERIKVLHRFMASIESNGGRYKNHLGVLIRDFDRWVEGVYHYQNELAKVKKDMTISIIIGLMVGAMSSIMSLLTNETQPGVFNISNDLLYQITSFIFIILNLLLYMYITSHFNVYWFKNDDEKVMKDYNMVYGNTCRKLMLKMLPVWIVLSVVSFIMLFVNNKAAGVLILIEMFLILTPYIEKYSAKKRVTDYVYSGFSEWLRQLSRGLGVKTLSGAVIDTYDNCPVIMKKQLHDFIEEIELNESDVRPYYEFMSEFEIFDISAIVRELFAFSEMTESEADKAVNSLIDRNYNMLDRHERQYYKDRISVFRFMEYIPAMMAALKIGVDIMLTLTTCMTI